MKRFWRRVVCLVRGHALVPTGRNTIILREWECGRCGGIYVSNCEEPGVYLPGDADSDRIFQDVWNARQNSRW